MEFFKNRPLALSMTVFAAVSVVAYRLQTLPKLILLILFLAVAVAAWSFFFKRHDPRRLGLALCSAGVFFALLSSYCFFDVRYADLQRWNGKTCVAEGIVLERQDTLPFSTQLRVRVTDLSCEEYGSYDGSLLAYVECGYPSTLQVGDRFRMETVPRASDENDAFDDEAYRISDGYLLILTCEKGEDCTRLSEAQPDLFTTLSKWNRALSLRLSERMGGGGELAAALLLGNREGIPSSVSVNFQRAGISHLFALSGLHVSILVGFLEFLLRKMQTPKLVRAILVPLSALGYLLLTGCAVSTCRAVMMLYALYLAFLLRADYDAFTALCIVLTAILLITPYAVLDIAMWMSFLSTAAIIVFAPLANTFFSESDGFPSFPRRLCKWLVRALLVSVVANLALVLVSALVFGKISLMSVPATLLLSLPVAALLILSGVLLCLPFLPVLPACCRFLEQVILQVSKMISDMDGVMIPVWDAVTAALLGLVTLSLILLAVLKVKHRLWFASPLVLFVLAVAVSLGITHGASDQQATVEAGFGKAYLYARRGECVLVNEMSRSSSAAYEIEQTALSMRCTEIARLICPNYYNQETYYLHAISGRIHIEELYLPPPKDAREEGIAKRLEEEAARLGIRVVYGAITLPPFA